MEGVEDRTPEEIHCGRKEPANSERGNYYRPEVIPLEAANNTEFYEPAVRLTEASFRDATDSRCLEVYYTNCQSLFNKLDELKIIADEQKPSMIALTETWLNEAIQISEVSIEGYQMFRCDRSQRRGGGVALYVANEFSCFQREIADVALQRFELMSCTIKIRQLPALNVCVVYRPPCSSENDDVELLRSLKAISKLDNLLLLGDFNAPGIDWISHEVKAAASPFNHHLLQFSSDEYLLQHIDFATRLREGQRSNCLDLVFTKEQGLIREVNPQPPLGFSDHVAFTCVCSPLSPQSQTKRRRNIWKADFEAMRCSASAKNWFSDANDAHVSWQHFQGTIENLIEVHCPMKIIRPCARPPWVNRTIKRTIKKKQRKWKKYVNLRDQASLAEYKSQRNICRREIRMARSAFERQLTTQATLCPKKFYGYIRSRRKHRDDIATLRDNLGNVLTEGPLKVQLLSEFFRSTFTAEPQNYNPGVEVGEETATIETVTFSVTDVRHVLSHIKPDKSPGPDGIPGLILKELSTELALPLSSLFELSMRTGDLPLQWKTANIAPIYKGGSKMAANSFRPISLTCLSCKMMEVIIKQAILRFCDENDVIQNFQHGFRRGRSCLSNLLTSLEAWTHALEEGFEVDVVYIDFRKAFDSVPHERLLHKLSLLGIRGKLLNWIRAFLVGRKQRVCIGDDQSDWVDVVSGVPQGSVLGPLLFILYVNDSLQDLDCGKIMFADDVKLWQVIKHPSDREALQENLCRLQMWSERWLLDFNVQKCAVLNLRPTNRPIPHGIREYYLNDTPIPTESSQKDLGIWIQSNLKPSLQCVKAANKATGVLHAIKRAFLNFDQDLFGKVYGTFVRPHLEYGIQAWRPWLAKDTACMEKVQRRATKLVRSLRNQSYVERLSCLNLFPLHYRQQRGDFILVYKIIHGLEKGLRFEDMFQWHLSPFLRGHTMKLRTKRSRLNLRSEFFTQRVIQQWNNLPQSVAEATSLQMFKQRLDNCMYPLLPLDSMNPS